MSDTSPRLSLPYLQPSQAQKHVTHNEALQQLDFMVQLTVQSFDATTPPMHPVDGDVYALGAGATGAWAGQDGMLAIATDTAWLFSAPQEGWRAWDLVSGKHRVMHAGIWKPLAAETQNLDGIGLNTVSDSTNRLAVAAPATLLSHEGAGHQLKINKAAAGDTASLLMQTNWSGRAEMGLASDDDFSIKTSSDGTTWTTGLRLHAATGTAELNDVEVSGGVYLGGNTPQNRLAHYETGSYIPALIDMSGNSVSLAPKRISFVQIGDQITFFFNFMNNLDTTGLVAGDDVALSLPVVNGSHSFGAVELQSGIGKPGPYHWYAQLGQPYLKLRSVSSGSLLKVSDITSGVSDIIGGTITLSLI